MGKNAVALCQEPSVQEFREGYPGQGSDPREPGRILRIRPVRRPEVARGVRPIPEAVEHYLAGN